jgi:hypothetical protein
LGDDRFFSRSLAKTGINKGTPAGASTKKTRLERRAENNIGGDYKSITAADWKT